MEIFGKNQINSRQFYDHLVSHKKSLILLWTFAQIKNFFLKNLLNLFKKMQINFYGCQLITLEKISRSNDTSSKISFQKFDLENEYVN